LPCHLEIGTLSHELPPPYMSAPLRI
jgi:hypothetical protein